MSRKRTGPTSRGRWARESAGVLRINHWRKAEDGRAGCCTDSGAYVMADDLTWDAIQPAMQQVRASLQQVIVGQESVIDGVMIGLLTGGHVLLQSVPGLGKTLLVKTLGEVLQLQTARVQGMPDLMPVDLLGTPETPGPIYTQLLLMDEVNRSTPKLHAALLEAMQERRVTVQGVSLPLPQPFLVLATQNPIESGGTYALPEAQMDRFLLKYDLPSPDASELKEIARRTTQGETPTLTPVLTAERICAMQVLVRQMPVPDAVLDAAVELIQATHPDAPTAPHVVQRFVLYGCSPRGAQAIILAGKAHALIQGRETVTLDDLRAVAVPALQHRLILTFGGAAAGIMPGEIIASLVGE